MKNLKYIGLSLLVLLSLGFNGCSTMQVDKDLVKAYKMPVQVSNDETLVYVIRESSFVGGARGLWIGLNENTIADLGSGDYTYFKVKKGINTINTIQMMTGFNYYAIDKMSTNPIFLKFNYVNMTAEELPTDLGISYVANYTEVKTLPNKKYNDGYINGLLNLAMYKNLNIMSETNTTLNPDSNNAVITFVRPDTFAGAINYTIWGDENILGNLYPKSFFQIKVPKGKHTFYVKSQTLYALEANVVANKNYVVELALNMGWTKAHARLNPINLNENNEYLNWILSSKHFKLNEVLDENIQERVKLALPIIRTTKAEIISGTKKPEHLPSNFGK